jgi:hypothetical protein
VSQRKQIRDPNKTKTGKTRLGGLTVPQLSVLLEREGKKKIRAKIRNRIQIVRRRPGYVEKIAEVAAAE